MFLKWLETEKSYESLEKSLQSIKAPEKEEEIESLEKLQEIPKQEKELKVPHIQVRRSVSPIEQRLDTVEKELKAFTLEKSDDEFKDVIDDDYDENSITEMSEPTASTVIENPDWTSQMLQKIESLAENLPKISDEPNIEDLVTVEPSSLVIGEKNASNDISLPNNIQIGQKVIHLEGKNEVSYDNMASDEEIVIESKLTISNSHVELTTLKTSSSQTSLNKIGSRRSSLSNSQINLAIDSDVPLFSKTNSLTNLSENSQKHERLISHGKGKAPVPPVLLPKASPSAIDASKPPLPMKPISSVDRTNKEKKRKSGGLFSTFTGIFKSDHGKDSDSHGDETPKETRI